MDRAYASTLKLAYRLLCAHVVEGANTAVLEELHVLDLLALRRRRAAIEQRQRRARQRIDTHCEHDCISREPPISVEAPRGRIEVHLEEATLRDQQRLRAVLLLLEGRLTTQ